MTVTVVSHAAAGLGFLVLGLLLILGRSRSRLGILLLIASVATSAWGFGVAYGGTIPSSYGTVMAESTLELVRTAAWLVFLAALVGAMGGWLGGRGRHVGLTVAVVIVAAILIGVDDYLISGASEDQLGPLFVVRMTGRLAFAILGLVLIENIYRAAQGGSLWALKFLVLGAGTIFVYDFFLYADGLLLSRLDPRFVDARGAVNAMTVPLLAVAASRNRDWSIDIHVSRDAVFHMATAVGAGAYMIAMAAVGYYLRNFGGEWGTLLQISFLSAAVLFMFVALFSAAARANLRVLIAKSFFSYQYDYRYEWLRFISTISSSGGSLYDRTIRAVANIVDSPSGAIWVRWPGDDSFQPAAFWNFATTVPHVSPDSDLVGFLEDKQLIIDLKEYGRDSAIYQGLELPAWLAELDKAWLILPFLHRGRLQGFLIVGNPRVRKKLNWEDFDLLKTVGRQVASYLAEEGAVRALVDADHLQRFNRRFAFVIHDIKNIASQLSLMLSNSERHGDNPEFQRDAMNTVNNSVAKMRALLEELDLEKAVEPEPPALQPVALGPCIRAIALPWMNRRPVVNLDLENPDAEALAEEERLTAALNHLVQNAVEAAGLDGTVTLRQRQVGGDAVIEVVDDGPGMEPAFIRDELFRPLQSTKRTGYGIGAFQTRELIREMEGRLDVESASGQGTVMRVSLRGLTPIYELPPRRAQGVD